MRLLNADRPNAEPEFSYTGSSWQYALRCYLPDEDSQFSRDSGATFHIRGDPA